MLSVFCFPLNKFPTTGTSPTPGVCCLLLVKAFFLIPPITTISPSAINNFVLISILLIAGSPGLDLLGVSLLTWISRRTFPSPIILGVTVIFNAASLKEVSAPSAELEAYGISSPCVMVAT